MATLSPNSSKINPHNQMCSLLSREQGEDPVGHGSAFDRLIITELPKPWPRPAINGTGAPPGLRGLVDQFQTLRKRTIRESGEDRTKALGLDVTIKHVAPDPQYSLPGQVRVLHLQRPQAPFSTYLKEEYQVPEREVAALVEALLYQQSCQKWQGALDRSSANVRDLLVCTQGNVDTCCATFGYPLYRELRTFADRSDGNLRVWQATHFQNHRFAPVILDLPEVRFWGGVGPRQAETLALRNRPPAILRNFYIGWAGVSQGYVQAAERETLVREGWGWTTYGKSGRITRLQYEEERAEVRIDFTSVDHQVIGSYRATVEVTEHIRGLVGCLSFGKTRDVPQYHVSNLKREPSTETSKSEKRPRAGLP